MAYRILLGALVYLLYYWKTVGKVEEIEPEKYGKLF